MSATVIIAYPRSAKFDMKYYLSQHMPAVEANGKQHGLRGWKVVQFGPDAPYSVHAVTEWDSVESFKKAAAGPEGHALNADLVNYTDSEPVVMVGEDAGSSARW